MGQQYCCLNTYNQKQNLHTGKREIKQTKKQPACLPFVTHPAQKGGQTPCRMGVGARITSWLTFEKPPLCISHARRVTTTQQTQTQ